ncbi:MAG TPA: hypothetical protein VD995_10945 [Azospirillum sp.]|nr:hypothetical protein [Azospirillum sp.]
MLSVYLAARELERRRAQDAAEFARQLPLHVEEITHWRNPVMTDPDGEEAPRTEPDWASNY